MVIPLAALLIAVLALGFMAMQAMLERLTQESDSSGVLGVLLSPVQKVLHVLNRAQRTVWKELVSIMSRFAGASIHALAHWFWSLERLVVDTSHGIASLAETVADAFEHALTHTIPGLIRTAVQHEATLRRSFDEQMRRYARGIDRLVRDHVIPRVRAVERAVTVTIPREFERVRAREKAIAARIPKRLYRRLTRLEKITAAAAIAGVVIKTIARRFPWLFCRKTARVGKALCGIDSDLIDGLLLGTLVVWSGFSIVEAVKDLQAIEDEAIRVMQTIIREL